MKTSFLRFLKGSRKKQASSVDPTTEEFFESRYQKSDDPWNFASSSYEGSRYKEIIQALPEREFRRVFEPGCSVGVLTEQLAPRCHELQALDISKTAVLRAQERCRRFPHVHVRHGALPDDIPEGAFDLIIFSEIGYYFRLDALRSLLDTLVNKLPPGGVFLASHWLGKSSDHVLPGGAVQDLIGETPGLAHSAGKHKKEFRLDVWARE